MGILEIIVAGHERLDLDGDGLAEVISKSVGWILLESSARLSLDEAREGLMGLHVGKDFSSAAGWRLDPGVWGTKLGDCELFVGAMPVQGELLYEHGPIAAALGSDAFAAPSRSVVIASLAPDHRIVDLGFMTASAFAATDHTAYVRWTRFTRCTALALAG